jgi:ferredoxin
MAMRILEGCINCGWCRPKCPTGAIDQQGAGFAINPVWCTVCQGVFDGPQCLAVCPIEGAIGRA